MEDFMMPEKEDELPLPELEEDMDLTPLVATEDDAVFTKKGLPEEDEQDDLDDTTVAEYASIEQEVALKNHDVVFSPAVIQAEAKFETQASDFAKVLSQLLMQDSKQMTTIMPMTMANIIKNTTNKEDSLLFLYVLIKELAKIDKTGNCSVEILSSGIISRLYSHYGQREDSYYEGTIPEKIINSKAALIDAFANFYFPMYTKASIRATLDMTYEMMYPDRFLNIFFLSLQRVYLNDVEIARTLSACSYPVEDRGVLLEMNLGIMESERQKEDSYIMSFFTDHEKANLAAHMAKDLKNLMGEDTQESMQELKRLIQGIPSQILNSTKSSKEEAEQKEAFLNDMKEKAERTYEDLRLRIEESSQKNQKMYEDILERLQGITLGQASNNMIIDENGGPESHKPSAFLSKIDNITGAVENMQREIVKIKEDLSIEQNQIISSNLQEIREAIYKINSSLEADRARAQKIIEKHEL